MSLLSKIRSFFVHRLSVVRGDRLLIAFSGGPDSTALLWSLKQLESDLDLRLHAIHIDHGLDADSPRRAEMANRIGARFKVETTVVKHPVGEHSRPGESQEATSRRVRYELLETYRRRLAAAYVVTAHHAEDLIETLLIRILYGTGIEGLAAIQPRHRHVVRPMLTVRRQEIHQALVQADLEPIRDPTNLHLGNTRNRIRHLLLPRLRQDEPDLDELLLRLAETASRVRIRIEDRLRRETNVKKTLTGGSIDRRALQRLPESLWPFALALVHREADIAYPPSAAARQELQCQLATSTRIGVDCGGGWRWECEDDELTLSTPSPSVPSFAYTVEAPGECEIAELSLRFRIRRGAVDAWMFRPSSHRAGLDLPIRPGDRVIVRSRRPGDRIRPFGCSYTRRLKDVLIDRRVPRPDRGRLPLLEVDSRLAWIPGVTLDNSYRVKIGGRVWIAELESI